MPDFADLHIHTNFSDSTSSPQEVVEQARDNGLKCISITDHDTIDGIDPTIAAALNYDIEVISGIELSSEMNHKDVHILGYLMDYKNPEFVNRINCIQNARIGRMQEMIGKLKAIGIENITLEEVCELAKSKSVGRPHLATVLIEKGLVANNQMAFDRYLADGAPAYVPKFKQTPYEAIELIRKFGGIAVLAHPMLTKVDELISSFVEAGLGGIEVHYPNTSEVVKKFYERLANKYGLVVTGGSDAHGNVKKHTYVGKVKMPYALVENLRNSTRRI